MTTEEESPGTVLSKRVQMVLLMNLAYIFIFKDIQEQRNWNPLMERRKLVILFFATK